MNDRQSRTLHHIRALEAADRRRDAAREKRLRVAARRMGLALSKKGEFYALLDAKTLAPVSGTVDRAAHIYNLDEILASFKDWQKGRRRRRPR